MSGTCIGHIMRANVRPCLGHGIGIETRASVRHVWDMHWPQDDMASAPYPCLRLNEYPAIF
ncbi:hypothetical protein F383_31246 [Gossypium arboreum]|uniref:Uncharacterized protein n=1 Tax=Gossypium arboreum TaxID=29729 RepID=A0A0B0PJY0_GOSAR|nr:hypothetical protein F383_31246 [Gossypium arboreum]